VIQVIYGKKGSGKTKRLIDLANDSIKEEKGDVLFIDDDNRYMFALRHEIRFINAGEYDVHSAQTFIGFICGLLAQNFDIRVVFVDAFLKLVREDVAALEWLFTRLAAVGERHGVDFIISCNGDAGGAPAYMTQYLI
jgi:thymidine kinase